MMMMVMILMQQEFIALDMGVFFPCFYHSLFLSSLCVVLCCVCQKRGGFFLVPLFLFLFLAFATCVFCWTVSSALKFRVKKRERKRKKNNSVYWSWQHLQVMIMVMIYGCLFLSMMIRVVRVGPECRVLQPFCFLLVRHWWLLQCHTIGVSISITLLSLCV